MTILLFVLAAVAHAAFDPRVHCADLFEPSGPLRARLLREKRISPVEAERTAIVNGLAETRARHFLDLKGHLGARRRVAVVARPFGPPLVFTADPTFSELSPATLGAAAIGVAELNTVVRENRGAWIWEKPPRALDVGVITKIEFLERYADAVREMFRRGSIDEARLATAIVVRDFGGSAPILLVREPVWQEGAIVGYQSNLHFFDPATCTRIAARENHQYRLDTGDYYLRRDGHWFVRPSAHALGRVRDEATDPSFRQFLMSFPEALNQMPFGVNLRGVNVARASSDHGSALVLAGFDVEGEESSLRLVFDPAARRFLPHASSCNRTFTFEDSRRFSVDARGVWRALPAAFSHASLNDFLAEYPEALAELPSDERLALARAERARDEVGGKIFWIIEGVRAADPADGEERWLFDPEERRFVIPRSRAAPRNLTLIHRETERIGFNLDGRTWTELAPVGAFERARERERARQEW